VKIHAIQTGEVQIRSRQLESRRTARPARVLDVLTDREWAPRIPILCWAIEHPEGTIVVDTGESSHVNDPGYVPSWHLFAQRCTRFWVEPEQEVGAQLHGLGINPGGVRTVVMTHMHGDHAGGLHHFPNAEFLMSETEAKAAWAKTGPLDGYFNNHFPEWLDPCWLAFDSGRWESFDATHSLTEDGAVRVVPTPGHTKGHVSVAIDRGDDVVVLVGDAAYSERAVLEGIIDGVAKDARAHRDSTARLRELGRRRPTIFLPAHDPESIRRLRDGAHTRVPA
jgi:glyoxylase-like metal-dependent hydrolase (beta-lactamase superfamily II)